MKREDEYGKVFFMILKGTGLALVFSLLASFLFATVLQTSAVPDKAIYPINQTLKALAAFLGALLFVRGEKGWLKGGEIGLMFTALSYVTYSVIGGNYALSLLVLAELFFTVFAGSVGGVVAVNVKK